MIFDAAGHIRMRLDLTLANMSKLWDSATLEAATVHAMDGDEIGETLGPREDPDVAACAALLFDTVARRSGAFDSITITVTSPEEQQATSEGISQASSESRDHSNVAICFREAKRLVPV